MRVHKATLATMRQTIADLRHGLSVTEIAATLAITTKPDFREIVRDDRDRYIVSAYGLTRSCGGYITIRFVCPGQRDTMYFHLFEEWKRQCYGPMTAVAGRIDRAQYELLQPADGSPIGTRYVLGADK